LNPTQFKSIKSALNKLLKSS